jgi:outer membrane protein OmpA-like peptidoglycan-associated protein
MEINLIRTSGVAALFIAASSVCSIALAGDVKQMGAQPAYDQLIKSLTPDASQVGPGNSRGLRVLSGRTPPPSQTGSGAVQTATAQIQSQPQDTRAPAVALDVRFATGSDQLTDAARDTVSRIGAALKSSQLASYRFLVEGHTDSTGNPDANLDLSKRRAEAVKSFLVAEGMPGDRLETVGKGSSEPIDAEHPASGVNRRVQIVNLGQ